MRTIDIRQEDATAICTITFASETKVAHKLKMGCSNVTISGLRGGIVVQEEDIANLILALRRAEGLLKPIPRLSR